MYETIGSKVSLDLTCASLNRTDTARVVMGECPSPFQLRLLSAVDAWEDLNQQAGHEPALVCSGKQGGSPYSLGLLQCLLLWKSQMPSNDSVAPLFLKRGQVVEPVVLPFVTK